MLQVSQHSRAVGKVLFYGWGIEALKNWLAQSHWHLAAELRKETLLSNSLSSTLSETPSFLSIQFCTCFPMTNRWSKWSNGLSWLENINCDSEVNQELKFPCCWQWPWPLELRAPQNPPGDAPRLCHSSAEIENWVFWDVEQAPVNCEFYLYVCPYFCREIIENVVKEEEAT